MADKPRNIYATAPDGKVVKRRTANDYAWAVLAYANDERGWTLENCSGSRAGAEKALARLRNFGYRAVIAPVRETKDEPLSQTAVQAGYFAGR